MKNQENTKKPHLKKTIFGNYSAKDVDDIIAEYEQNLEKQKQATARLEKEYNILQERTSQQVSELLRANNRIEEKEIMLAKKRQADEIELKNKIDLYCKSQIADARHQANVILTEANSEKKKQMEEARKVKQQANNIQKELLARLYHHIDALTKTKQTHLNCAAELDKEIQRLKIKFDNGMIDFNPEGLDLILQKSQYIHQS
jgi:DNA repair exonuclease SbcCD ATPase subunit